MNAKQAIKKLDSITVKYLKARDAYYAYDKKMNEKYKGSSKRYDKSTLDSIRKKHCAAEKAFNLLQFAESLDVIKEEWEAYRYVDFVLDKKIEAAERNEKLYDVIMAVLKRESLYDWQAFLRHIDKLLTQAQETEEYRKKENPEILKILEKTGVEKRCFTEEKIYGFAQETLIWSVMESMNGEQEIKVINADKKPFDYYAATVTLKNEIVDLPKTREELFAQKAVSPYALLAYMAENFEKGVIDARLFPLLNHFAAKEIWDTKNLNFMSQVNIKDAPAEMSEAYMFTSYIAHRFGACGKPDREKARMILLECCPLVRLLNMDYYYSYAASSLSPYRWDIDDALRHRWKTTYLRFFLEEYRYCCNYNEYKTVLSRLTLNNLLSLHKSQETTFRMYVATGNPRLLVLMQSLGQFPLEEVIEKLDEQSDSKIDRLLIDALTYVKDNCSYGTLNGDAPKLSDEELGYYNGLTTDDVAKLPKEKLQILKRLAPNAPRCAFTLGTYYFELGDYDYRNYIQSAMYYSYVKSEAASLNRIICFENIAIATGSKMWQDKASELYANSCSPLLKVKYLFTEIKKYDTAQEFEKRTKSVYDYYCGKGQDDKSAHLIATAYNIAHPLKGAYDYLKKNYSLGMACCKVYDYREEFDEYEIGLFAHEINGMMLKGLKEEPSRYEYLRMLDAGIEKDSYACKELKAYFLCSNESAHMRMKNGERYGHYSDWDRKEDERAAYDIIVNLNGKYKKEHKQTFERILREYRK